MNIIGRRLLIPWILGCLGALVPSVFADELPARVRFAPPKRIMAGGKLLGEGRLYPSPVFHDIDGDGRADLVVGDLVGRVTVALRAADGRTFGAEAPLKGRDGKPLKFHNW